MTRYMVTGPAHKEAGYVFIQLTSSSYFNKTRTRGDGDDS